MSVARAIRCAKVLTAATLIVADTAFVASASRAAEGPALPPAEYKPLPVGTKIEYDNAIYIVARAEGYTTVFKKQVGGTITWISTHAGFGEYGADVYVHATRGEVVEYDLDAENKKKLEALWPLAIGKETTYRSQESKVGAYGNPAQVWTVTLKVSKTETIDTGSGARNAYVIEERAESDGGMSFSGHKWYDPASGLIVMSRRIGTGQNSVGELAWNPKIVHLGKDQEETFVLRRVDFPPGSAPATVAAAGKTLAARPPAAARPALPPAEYKPLPVGTRIEYNNATYTVAKQEGFATVFKKQVGGSSSWVTTHALFGEHGANVYATMERGDPNDFDLDGENRKKLEALWPLAIGKEVTFRLDEAHYYGSAPQLWTVMLKVTGTELIEMGGMRFQTYVVDERAKSDKGLSLSGRKWYDPASGLIVRSWRIGTGNNAVQSFVPKIAILGKDQEETFSLLKVDFPPGAAPAVVAAARATTTSAKAPQVPQAVGPALPPAEYKPLPAGTKVDYDNRTFTVAKSEGFTTVLKQQVSGTTTWVSTHALFGEYGADVYARYSRGEPNEFTLGSESKRMLEALWPLAVGKATTYQLHEAHAFYTVAQLWTITLKVTGTETIETEDRRYDTYVVEERGESDVGMSFAGRKWYHPASGLIIRSTRTGTGTNEIGNLYYKVANLGKDQNESYALRRVNFPPGTDGVLVAAAQGTAGKPTVTTDTPGLADVERLKRVAEQERQAADALRARQAGEARKAEEVRQAEEARKVREAEEEKARVAEMARLRREAEETRKAVAARKAREAEEKAAREAEIARVNREIEERRKAETDLTERESREIKARAAEVARLTKEAEERRKADEARKAREADEERARAAEFARLNRQIEDTRKAEEARKARAAEEERGRAAEVGRLRREAEAAQRAAAEREAEVARRLKVADEARKAREVEIAQLKQEAEQVLKAREAEMAKRLKEADEARKARETEIAKLKQEADQALKAREAEIARLKEADKARKARETEIAKLKQEADQALKAREAEIARLKQTLSERREGAIAGTGGSSASFSGIDFGRYHALVIGIDNYKQLPKLNTAVNDARGVAAVLEKDYGFTVTLLLEATRIDIVDALDVYLEKLGRNDNLLIYYAGHGWLDRDGDRGYWLPIDAEPKRRRDWVSNATVTGTLRALGAKHVMVIADSCYSGTLVRGAEMGTRTRSGDYWKQMATKWARVAITSGGLEPVADAGGGGHSPFAKAFIDALGENAAVMDGTQLFSQMRRPVMVNARQTPQYADVREAGHDGGDFLFVRKK